MRIQVLLLTCFAIGACSNAGSIAREGQITVVSNKVRSSITSDDLTNPQAYFKKMDTLIGQAPPDVTDRDGKNARVAFFKAQIGEYIDGTFLMPIACSDEERQPYINIETSTKTLDINLVNIDEPTQGRFQEMVDALDALNAQLLDNWTLAARGYDADNSQFKQKYRALLQEVDLAGRNASILALGEGRQVAVSNNPLSLIETTILLGISSAELSMAETRLASITDGRISSLDTEDMDAARDVVIQGAQGRGVSGWSVRIAHATDDPVCVIGQFSYIDPVPGGRYSHFYHPKGAGYSSSLIAWYVVSKDNLKILHTETELKT